MTKSYLSKGTFVSIYETDDCIEKTLSCGYFNDFSRDLSTGDVVLIKAKDGVCLRYVEKCGSIVIMKELY